MIFEIVKVALAAVAVGIGLWQARAARVRQIEDDYVKRYWELLDQMSLDTLHGTGRRRLSEQDRKAVSLYFRLCEDQADLRANGWVSDKVWVVWHDSMRAKMRQPSFDTLWQQDLANPDRDYGFEHLQEICRTWPSIHDPKPRGRLKRCLRRLRWWRVRR